MIEQEKNPASRFDHTALINWAKNLLIKAGSENAVAVATAEVLVEGELLGHDTHGLALLPIYQDKLTQGEMFGVGRENVLSDRGALTLWDGGRILGPYLALRGIAEARNRARHYGTATVVIRQCGHLGCLAAYLEAPARDGFLIEIFSSDPSVAVVAPFGGCDPIFTPNPIAIGIPSSSVPIMVDVSMSITTNGRVRRAIDRNERLPGAWLQDASGQPTDDPTVTQQVPPGTLQLLGGPDAGHKGFGLTLAVEAMTGGLAGYGRADHHQHFGANVMIRLTDISAFGDPSLFQAQTDWLIAACQKNRPISAAHPVRLPGERGLKNKADGLKNGLHLSPEILTKLSAMNYSDYPFPRPSQEHR